MPTTINNLLNKAGLDKSQLKTVKWGQRLDSSSIGIYIVSTSGLPNENTNLHDNAPIDEIILRSWLDKVGTLQLDGKQNPTIKDLKNRLNNFWLPDENIIYIGQTESGGGLKSRVNQYYRTDLGERKPHAGGHWIKILKTLNQLYVHYIPTQKPNDTEEELLRYFIEQVSDKSKQKLFDPTLPIPFANLELERGNRKKHGISKSKLGD